jgi:Transposase DDE domain group 1
VVAKVEWHPGELYPRVGFIVTNLARPAERIVAFYNQRGTAEQWIKEGKGAIKWTRLSCRSFADQRRPPSAPALAYNLGNLMRTLAMPKTAEPWSLTSLREKLIKIGAKVVSHDLCDIPDGRSRGVVADFRRNPLADRPVAGTARGGMKGLGDGEALITMGEVRLTEGKATSSSAANKAILGYAPHGIRVADACCAGGPKSETMAHGAGNLGNVG